MKEKYHAFSIELLANRMGRDRSRFQPVAGGCGVVGQLRSGGSAAGQAGLPAASRPAASSRRAGCAIGPWRPAQGITGHLDEYHSVFHDAWKGPAVKGTSAAADGTGWPLEQCAYWLDGALRLGFVLHDEALIEKIRARLDPIVDGVNKADFGTTFIYWKKGYKPEGFNSWAHSQMGRALVALYQGTGDKRVLDALVKVYADYPAKMGTDRLQRRTRPVQPGRHAGDLFLQRRPADPRSRAGRPSPSPRWQGSSRPGARAKWPPATRSSSTKTSACRPWSIPGRATASASGHARRRSSGWTRTTCSPTACPPARKTSAASGPSARRRPAT